MRAELIGHFQPCMTEIYLHIDAPIISARTRSWRRGSVIPVMPPCPLSTPAALQVPARQSGGYTPEQVCYRHPGWVHAVETETETERMMHGVVGGSGWGHDRPPQTPAFVDAVI